MQARTQGSNRGAADSHASSKAEVLSVLNWDARLWRAEHSARRQDRVVSQAGDFPEPDSTSGGWASDTPHKGSGAQPRRSAHNISHEGKLPSATHHYSSENRSSDPVSGYFSDHGFRGDSPLHQRSKRRGEPHRLATGALCRPAMADALQQALMKLSASLEEAEGAPPSGSDVSTPPCDAGQACCAQPALATSSRTYSFWQQLRPTSRKSLLGTATADSRALESAATATTPATMPGVVRAPPLSMCRSMSLSAPTTPTASRGGDEARLNATTPAGRIRSRMSEGGALHGAAAGTATVGGRSPWRALMFKNLSDDDTHGSEDASATGASPNGRVRGRKRRAIKNFVQRLAQRVSGSGVGAKTSVDGSTGDDAIAAAAAAAAAAPVFTSSAQATAALLSSAKAGASARAVRALLAAGADVHAADAEGNTPLMLAVARGHTAVVEALLAAGAGANSTYNGLLTVLMCAAQEGHVGVVAALLGAGADVHAHDIMGHTALMHATAIMPVGSEQGARRHLRAWRSGPNGSREVLAVVHALLAAGADANTAARNGMTPLMNAAHAGDVAVVRALLAAGADPMAADKSGRTALQEAIVAGHTLVAEVLAAARADAGKSLRECMGASSSQ